MVKNDKFRIEGTVLDEPDGYIDVEISGIDTAGKIYISEVDSDREWSMKIDEMKNLLQDDRAIPQSKIEKNKLWKYCAKVGKYIKKGNVSSPFAVEHAEQAQKELFAAAFEESR